MYIRASTAEEQIDTYLKVSLPNLLIFESIHHFKSLCLAGSGPFRSPTICLDQ
jgi:hypothetical protein